MSKITLSTKEQLNIYMSPVRQQLLRQLNLSNVPLTPKMLADKLNLSASTMQHHIKKLTTLGVIELDHTEIINGITARFYKPVKVTVQIGLGLEDGLDEQRDVLIQENIAQVYSGFRKQMSKRLNGHGRKESESFQKWGDILSGVVHLSKNESEELMKLISDFIDKHSAPSNDSCPWEYAIIAYNAEVIERD